MGVTPSQLAALYPRLYHMAEADSWASIQQHGLLSTEALVDLFEVDSIRRDQILLRRRNACAVIQHPAHGRAVVRDQKPLSSSKLAASLTDCSFDDWLRILNGRVFFWLSKGRLQTLMCAREYCARDHLVLELDTLRLATDLRENITLAPMNTGNTRPYAHPRGLSTFSRFEDYPFEERLRRGLYYTVVELAVERGVKNIMDYVLKAMIMRCVTCDRGKLQSIRCVQQLYP